jgi:hypothetical protein
MPLIQATLQNALEAIFIAKPPSAQAVAQQMATAYQAYAQTGLFGASIPAITPVSVAGLQNALLAAISNPKVGTAVQIAQAWSTGLLAFWLTPPVLVTGVQVGTVTLVPGAALIVAPLTGIFQNLKATEAIAAQAISSILHTATLTVTAVVAPPPATILTLL